MIAIHIYPGSNNILLSINQIIEDNSTDDTDVAFCV